MYNTVEYSYETDKRHLTDSEALDKYKKALIVNPDALVILNDLDCGHWDINVYKTENEKNNFYRKRFSRMYKQLMDKFRK